MRLKPILIPIDKQSIEVGDLTLPNCPNKVNEGELGIAVRSFVRNDAYKSYDIILIDSDAEIIEGDLYYYFDWSDEISILNGGISNVPMDEHGSNFVNSRKPAKIIASTNKSHNLPQLSEQSIQLLVNYYNEHKCMPEFAEVENDWYSHNNIVTNQHGIVDITIPKTEEKLYTESWIRNMVVDCDSDGGIRWDEIDEWFNSKKK